MLSLTLHLNNLSVCYSLLLCMFMFCLPETNEFIAKRESCMHTKEYLLPLIRVYVHLTMNKDISFLLFSVSVTSIYSKCISYFSAQIGVYIQTKPFASLIFIEEYLKFILSINTQKKKQRAFGRRCKGVYLFICLFIYLFYFFRCTDTVI